MRRSLPSSQVLQSPMAVAIGLSLLLHLMLLMVRFTPAEFQKRFTAPLEVILVNAQSDTTPKDAKVLAQVALDGGGVDDAGRATTLPSEQEDPVDQRALEAMNSRLAALEQLQKSLTGNGLRFPPHDAAELIEKKQQLDSQYAYDAKGLDPKSQRELEMKRLQAQIAANIKSYNERPRKHFFSPRTSPYEFAIYEEAWRQKVEREGNANYPEEVRGKIYGKLRLTAYIKSDGSLDDVEIDRSSGSAVLDRAALRILRSSAPFPPFTADMKKNIDVLAITRTWVFTRDTVTTEN